MTDEKQVTTEKPTGAPSQDGHAAPPLRPSVDIFEDAEGITLIADMAGVSRDRLNLHVENNALTIDGEMHIDMPQGIEALYADVRSTRYQRSFTLSRELDSDAISANLKDGVLNVHIPKREEARRRKIEVQVD